MPQGHLVIASGGTGGHFYPTLAIAREYVKAGGSVTLLVSGKHAKAQLELAHKDGLAAEIIDAVKLPTTVKDAVCFPFRFVKCFFGARAALKRLNGDVLLGMGSFAAVPSCLAWTLMSKKPLILHEGNAFMGRANRLFAGRANAIALSLPLRDGGQLRGAYSLVTGMPLREALIKASEVELTAEQRAERLGEYGLQAERRTVLVFGGSQGASAINKLVLSTISMLSPEIKGKLQFIVLTGTESNESMIRAFAQYGIPARVCASDQEIHKCYQVADLVVCRAGASSICELSLFGKPMLLIPLPTAADDHQTCNADTLAASGAAMRLAQRDATPMRFQELLKDWLDNPARWNDYGVNAKKFGHPEAAAAVAALISET